MQNDRVRYVCVAGDEGRSRRCEEIFFVVPALHHTLSGLPLNADDIGGARGARGHCVEAFIWRATQFAVYARECLFGRPVVGDRREYSGSRCQNGADRRGDLWRRYGPATCAGEDGPRDLFGQASECYEADVDDPGRLGCQSPSRRHRHRVGSDDHSHGRERIIALERRNLAAEMPNSGQPVRRCCCLDRGPLGALRSP